MAIIQYDDGTKIQFDGTPTQQDIDEAYQNAKGVTKEPGYFGKIGQDINKLSAPGQDRSLMGAAKATGTFVNDVLGGVPGNIINNAVEGVKQFGEGYNKVSQATDLTTNNNKSFGANAQDLGVGITDMASGGISTIFSPITGTVQSAAKLPGVSQTLDAIKNYIINPSSEAISDIKPLQEFMLKNPNADRVIGNLINIIGAVAGGKKAPEIKSAIGDTANAITDVAGNIKSKIGETSLNTSNKLGLNKDSAVTHLESDWEKWTGATKPGVKSLNKAEQRTNALNASGTEGKLPQRVLAESGVIPETTGTKFTTESQANTYHESLKPIAEAADRAVDEVSSFVAPTPIDVLEQQTIKRIKELGLTVGDEKALLNDAKNEYLGLRERYGDSMSLSEQKIEKSAYQKPVKFDSTKPFKTDFNYNMGKTFQSSIEKTAEEAGFPDVAQLNRELGDRYAAEKMLRGLDGQTLKYGKIGKYAMGVAGTMLGSSVPGKILGYMGGELVADLLMKADVANPIKRLILKGIEKNNTPEAYKATLKFLNDQGVLRDNRPKLPAGNIEDYKLGGKNNPIVTPSPTTYEAPAENINRTNSKSSS